MRFLIEATHDPDPWACASVVEVFLGTGSHYLSEADWGCADGEHTAWMIVDVDTKEEARRILPPLLREHARVVKLNKFTLESLSEIMRQHEERRRQAASRDEVPEGR